MFCVSFSLLCSQIPNVLILFFLSVFSNHACTVRLQDGLELQLWTCRTYLYNRMAQDRGVPRFPTTSQHEIELSSLGTGWIETIRTWHCSPFASKRINSWNFCLFEWCGWDWYGVKLCWGLQWKELLVFDSVCLWCCASLIDIELSLWWLCRHICGTTMMSYPQ